MSGLKECTICGVDNDDQTLYAFFTEMPVAFCINCQSHLQQYCKHN